MAEENKKNKKTKFVLAMETAVESGSLALYADDVLIDGWVGSGDGGSRSELLLVEIKRLLEKNELPKKMLNSIIISDGPGSLTGARIGLATAKGLSKSIGCVLEFRSVLNSMAGCAAVLQTDSESKSRKIITAIPLGKNRICWKTSKFGGGGEPTAGSDATEITSSADFGEKIKEVQADVVIVHESVENQLNLYEKTNGTRPANIVNVGGNLAVFIGSKNTVTNLRETNVRNYTSK